MNTPKTPVSIFLNGASGKMGLAIITACKTTPGVQISGMFDPTFGSDQQKHREQAFKATHGLPGIVAVDFTTPIGTMEILPCCINHNIPMVIGTTGHTEGERLTILETAKHIPIVMASNFSVGMNSLFWLTRKAAEILGSDFDLEVVEMHHRMKKDAPSGSAKTLVEILKEIRQNQLDVDRGSLKLRHGREGMVGGRTQNEIGIHAIRGGDVVGDHIVIFAGLG